ncbi:MAG: IS1182 family transposase, partial [Alphaproteobacteria bacterium]|nr:IS1182 family transposase [Alphaproteobacteria bacterium]
RAAEAKLLGHWQRKMEGREVVKRLLARDKLEAEERRLAEDASQPVEPASEGISIARTIPDEIKSGPIRYGGALRIISGVLTIARAARALVTAPLSATQPRHCEGHDEPVGRMERRGWARFSLPGSERFRFTGGMTQGRYKSGTERGQTILLPARVEDYVAADNPVRAIDAYVRGIDLAALGFKHASRGSGAGQPPYDPADLLKLYLYGYLNRVRSSRALERESGRNLEVMWLLRGQTPGYRTIAKFRADNAAALRQANRDLVRLLGELDLLGGRLVAIDGAFFDGSASKPSIVTARRLAEQLAALDRDIDAYAADLTAGDAEAAAAPDKAEPGGEAGTRMAALMARRERMATDLTRLEASGQTQLSRTDPDARLLSKSGQTLAGYNVQIAVDDKHKLIVASEVVSDGNDCKQLHPMAQAAKAALDVDALTVVADHGYYDGAGIRACEADGIEPVVPIPERGKRPTDGRFGLSDFQYEPDHDVYRCPGDQPLHRLVSAKRVPSGKLQRRYASRRSACRACPLRARCLSARATRREIERWEHEEVVQQHRTRMAGADAAAVLKRRKELAEHPFGTLKCRAGYRHFLVRGFTKVRGEWGLMALCYNLGRMLQIIGLVRFIAALAGLFAQLVASLLSAALVTVSAPIGHNERRAWA